MSLNRIQKLLFSEYCDFEDMVLVESPFAQTTREGLGLRQVQLGLTPTKLLLAVDVLPPVEESKIFWNDNVDPEIETLELIAVYPVECVNLSVYRRRKRQSLKAHFCNNRILYFELGGFEKRKMFWNLWCERVQFLCPEDAGSSISETSVATTTSNSTLHIISTNKNIDIHGNVQFWCKFGNGEGEQNHKCKWVEQYLYMDKPIKCLSDTIPKIGTSKKNNNEKISTTQSEKLRMSKSLNVNTLLTNLSEECNTELLLQSEDFMRTSKQISDTSTESTDFYTLYPFLSTHFIQLTENAVKCWEMSRKNSGSRVRHPRRYGIVPQSHFLHGFGPWNIHKGEKISTQMKRSVSTVRIRRQPDDRELTLTISKRLLTVSISCEAFHLDRTLNIDSCVSKLAVPDVNALLFWTPEYWYRPQPARDSYIEFLEHIRLLNKNLERKTKGRQRKKRFMKKNKKPPISGKYGHEIGAGEMNNFIVVNCTEEGSFQTYLQRLRTALKIEVALTAWDFDSTTLAYQLTMIDKELFLKIKTHELHIVMWQRSSRNAPNITSFIAFSHRISCLVATEILRDDSEKLRARLIVRFINIADKCDRIANFHSCKSILSGLQSPPVYRLHKTWAYLRLHHAVKYQLFENLCRRYADPRLLIYQKSFYLATVSPPYLPYIGDILARMLDRVVKLPFDFLSQITLDKDKIISHINSEKEYEMKRDDYTSDYDTPPIKQEKSQENQITLLSNKFMKFLSNFKLWQIPDKEISKTTNEESITKEKEIFISDKSYTVRNNCKNLEQSNKYVDNRKECLEEIVEFLDLCQKSAAKYALSTNDLAQEYLLKARYREDRENFYNSFKLEQKNSVS